MVRIERNSACTIEWETSRLACECVSCAVCQLLLNPFTIYKHLYFTSLPFLYFLWIPLYSMSCKLLLFNTSNAALSISTFSYVLIYTHQSKMPPVCDIMRRATWCVCCPRSALLSIRFPEHRHFFKYVLQ